MKMKADGMKRVLEMADAPRPGPCLLGRLASGRVEEFINARVPELLVLEQLQIERRCGRVFQGWKEGRICFPPTYQYSFNSDRYSGVRPKEKRRTPAWCDRILWYGNASCNCPMSVETRESRFSNHRPVYNIFMADVEIVRPRRSMGYFSSKIEDTTTLMTQVTGSLMNNSWG